jgi:hypothetical protein
MSNIKEQSLTEKLKTAMYDNIIVGSFCPDNLSGHHGPVHIRPAADQKYPQSFLVECSNKLKKPDKYPIGTKFRIKVKLTNREDGTPFLYSHYKWNCEVIK